ncbi:MAG: YihY/virulence factor BrkB family protein [Puniceicoccaceae bacterium]
MAKGPFQKFRNFLRRLPKILGEEIWRTPHQATGERSTALGPFYQFLRISTIIFRGVSGNKLFSLAAALSYYSLISLGPVLAIAIMISGFVLQRSDPSFVSETITKAIQFVAPTTAEWDRIQQMDTSSGSAELQPEAPLLAGEPESPLTPEAEIQGDPALDAEPPGTVLELDPELIDLINKIVESARSGAVGLIGSLTLIVIVIQMITSIEKSFNDIWGVRRGRSWAQRIVSYWTILSLGAVLTFAALTLLSASTLVGFLDSLPLPFGLDGKKMTVWIGPLLSLFFLTVLLAFFNRFFPNTFVRWKPALIGGGVAAILLITNHYLSFLYIHRVINQQSLYGSVGIIPVLMLGLYMFWLFVLLGGQVTYAVQNASSLTNESAWANISTRTREHLALAATLMICRHFKECRRPPSAGEIASTLRVPVQILNSCLTQLNDVGWISVIESKSEGEEGELLYQPGRPLAAMNLDKFHEHFDIYGNNDGVRLIDGIDPVVDNYRSLLRHPEHAHASFDHLLSPRPSLTSGD